MLNIRFIRKLFSDDLILFSIYLSAIGGKRRNSFRNIAHPETLAFMTGYQRSGNTFLRYLLENYYAKNKGFRIETHLHKIAAIKQAFKYKKIVFVNIREPLESVASSIVKKRQELRIGSDGVGEKVHRFKYKENDKTFIDVLLSDYINYYRFVLRNADKLHIILFDDLIKTPSKTIEYFNRITGYDSIVVDSTEVDKS